GRAHQAGGELEVGSAPGSVHQRDETSREASRRRVGHLLRGGRGGGKGERCDEAGNEPGAAEGAREEARHDRLQEDGSWPSPVPGSGPCTGRTGLVDCFTLHRTDQRPAYSAKVSQASGSPDWNPRRNQLI